MMFIHKSRGFLTIVLLLALQLATYSQSKKILIVNHYKVSSSVEVHKLLKEEVFGYTLNQEKIEIRDNYKKRKDWFRLTTEQKKSECKTNNIGSVIEIREKRSETKTVLYAKVVKWDYESPFLKPNEISYNWHKGSDLHSYYIDKAAYFAVYGVEKKDVVVIRFKYDTEIAEYWDVIQAIKKLHDDLASALPIIDKNLEKKYVFKKVEQKNDFTQIYITGTAYPESNTSIKMQLEMKNNTIANGFARKNYKFSYDYGNHDEFTVQVAKKILLVAKDKGILEF